MLRHLLSFLLIISSFKNGCLLDTRRTVIEFVYGTGKCCKYSMELVKDDVKAALDITTAGRWFNGVNGKHREKGETDVTETPRIDRLWRFRHASNLTAIY